MQPLNIDELRKRNWTLARQVSSPSYSFFLFEKEKKKIDLGFYPLEGFTRFLSFSFFFPLLFIVGKKSRANFQKRALPSNARHGETPWRKMWIDVRSRGKEMHGPRLPTSRKHASWIFIVSKERERERKRERVSDTASGQINADQSGSCVVSQPADSFADEFRLFVCALLCK